MSHVFESSNGKSEVWDRRPDALAGRTRRRLIERHRRRIAPLPRHAKDSKSPDAICPATTRLILA